MVPLSEPRLRLEEPWGVIGVDRDDPADVGDRRRIDGDARTVGEGAAGTDLAGEDEIGCGGGSTSTTATDHMSPCAAIGGSSSAKLILSE